MANKLTKLIQTVGAIIRKPYLLNAVLQTDDFWLDKISRDFPTYKLGLPQISLTQVLTESGSNLQPISFLGGGSMVTDIALLKSIAAVITPCSYFEIGTWRGESVANVAAVASECVTLNLSEADMNRLGWPQDYINQQAIFSKNLSNVSHVYGDSKTFDFAGLNKKFDLVFIDGDHHHDYVVNDTSNIWKHCIHSNSVVVWHDYAHNPEQFRPEVLHGILSSIPAECQGTLFHVANTLCAIYLPENWVVNPQPPLVGLSNPTYVYNVQIHPNSEG